MTDKNFEVENSKDCEIPKDYLVKIILPNGEERIVTEEEAQALAASGAVFVELIDPDTMESADGIAYETNDEGVTIASHEDDEDCVAIFLWDGETTGVAAGAFLGLGAAAWAGIGAGAAAVGGIAAASGGSGGGSGGAAGGDSDSTYELQIEKSSPYIESFEEGAYDLDVSELVSLETYDGAGGFDSEIIEVRPWDGSDRLNLVLSDDEFKGEFISINNGFLNYDTDELHEPFEKPMTLTLQDEDGVNAVLDSGIATNGGAVTVSTEAYNALSGTIDRVELASEGLEDNLFIEELTDGFSHGFGSNGSEYLDDLVSEGILDQDEVDFYLDDLSDGYIGAVGVAFLMVEGGEEDTIEFGSGWDSVDNVFGSSVNTAFDAVLGGDYDYQVNLNGSMIEIVAFNPELTLVV